MWAPSITNAFRTELASNGYTIVTEIAYRPVGDKAVSQWQLHTGQIPGLKRKPFAGTLSPEFFEIYHRCISRLQFSPFLRTPVCQAPGEIRADNVHDWMQLHAATADALLDRVEPDEVWFHTPPHIGIDNVLAEVARARRVRVVMCKNLPLFGKFDYEIAGEPDIPRLTEGWNRTEMGDFQPDLFYMAKVSGGRFRQPAPSWRSLLESGSLANFVDAVYRGALRRDWALPLALMDLAFEQDRSLAQWRLRRRRGLRRQWRRLESVHIDEIDLPFIYFALHYEPEEIVSSVQYPYCNQLNAIESLLSLAPPDWVVAVKENPKQRLMFRDGAFYERASTNPRIVWLMPETESADAVQQAQFTASLAGTVGYESLLSGKPCVYFGNPWYRDFTGAHSFKTDLDLEALSRQEVDRKAVLSDVNRFFSTRPDGMVHPRNRNLAPVDALFDEVAMQSARSLVRISQHCRAKAQ